MRFQELTRCLLIVVLLMPGVVFGDVTNSVIKAIATGSPTPTPATAPNEPLRNGDFLITPASSPMAGDGIDEETTWIFDFRSAPNTSSFPTSVPLISAQLTLTLEPKEDIETDIIRIAGLGAIETSDIRDLELDEKHTIQLELIGPYRSSDILDLLTNEQSSGQIHMIYEDDAIISFAQLNLVSSALGEALRLTHADVDLSTNQMTLRGDFRNSEGSQLIVVLNDEIELDQISVTLDEIVVVLPDFDTG
ncbi:hypothetical protein C2W62_26465 [Candidatus Entotheonella serta]|nr:hypothetical protein C2W62_26465 [Candidatus Entotheonella serta]